VPDDSAPRSARRPHPAHGSSARQVTTPIPSSGRPWGHGRAPSVGRAGRPPGTPPRHNLPPQPRSIIGREQDLALACQGLSRADVRLLTLTGPPGVGKTRLAVELAAAALDEFEDGARFVDLAPIADARLVPDAAARTLGLREADRRAPADVLEEFLCDKALLLVLDNFEQVLDAADLVGRLHAACPRLKVVATSRAPLRLRWECELPVPPLALPDLAGRAAPEALAASPAVRLFIERARAVAPDLVLGEAEAAAVAEICIHLDGLPLAIELAAARTKLFPPAALLRRLVGADDAATGPGASLRLLAGGARDLPPRHQTLLGAIAWSYALLDPSEQALFRRLAVFVGGCTLEAAEAVCGPQVSGVEDVGTRALRGSPKDVEDVGFPTSAAPSAPRCQVPGDGGGQLPDTRDPRPETLELVASLVDKSLVWRGEGPDGEPRLRLLETIREFGLEQLRVGGELEQTRRRHAEYFVDLAERAEPELIGPHQEIWLDRLDRERENLRAAERWAAARGDAETVVRLGAALWRFWWARADAAEARERVDAILALARGAAPVPALARALHGAGALAMQLTDHLASRTLLEEAAAVARRLGDRRTLAHVLGTLGRLEFVQGRYAEARAVLDECLAIAREVDDRAGLIRALSRRGFVEYIEGRQASARALFGEGLALARAAGDHGAVGEFLNNLGDSHLAEGDLDCAVRTYREALAVLRKVGEGNGLAWALHDLGQALALRGELEAARDPLREALVLARRMGNRRRQAFTLSTVAVLAVAAGQAERAVRVEAAASAAAAAIGVVPTPPMRELWGAQFEPARRALGEQGARPRPRPGGR
jgi:predicted ATPase